jgi:hypothetical protein
MDDEAVYGKRAHTLTFGDAVAKGIICPYKVLITLIDKQQVDDFSLKNGITLVEGDSVKAKWVARQIAVSSAIKHTNATKIITFHSRVKTAREFASDEIYGIKKFIDHFDVFHVHGKQKSNERKDTISKFRKATRSIITNAKCLTEGVDVPAVDMVAFVDPRHSKIDIAQAVGRAMRKPRGGDKKVGFIVVPIFSEDTSENSLENAIESEDFDDVALILNSLLEQDEELVEIIKELKQAKGRSQGFNPQRIKDKLEVIGPRIGLEELTNSIYVEVIDRLGRSWDEWYGRLIKFKEIEGHCRVNDNYVDGTYRLGKWVQKQRTKKNTLDDIHLKKLDDIGFIWDARLDNWQEGFDALIEYKNEYGDCLVPALYKVDNFYLGRWVSNQRTRKNITAENRIALLNAIGFVWDVLNANWLTNFKALVKYVDREGSCNISSKYCDNNLKLGLWVSHQRKNKEQLTIEQIDDLNSLHFIWDPLSEKWEQGFRALSKFNKREEHCVVPDQWVEDDFNLGTWVGVQRTRFNSGILSSLRKDHLDKLGFIWNVKSSQWEQKYQLLVKFKDSQGHCNVPQKYQVDNVQLGSWVSTQRANKFKLSGEQISRLNQLGFAWSLKSQKP